MAYAKAARQKEKEKKKETPITCARPGRAWYMSIANILSVGLFSLLFILLFPAYLFFKALWGVLFLFFGGIIYSPAKPGKKLEAENSNAVDAFSDALFSLALGLSSLLYLVFGNALDMLFPLFRGGIYVPTTKKTTKQMAVLAGVKPGEKAVDLGSGDGRLVIALAKQGAQAHGYEINPFLVCLAKYNIRRAGLKGKAFIHWKNFWYEDLSRFNIVAFYAIRYMMKGLEIKLRKELRPGARVVSNYFTFPSWPPAKKEGDAYLYEKGRQVETT